MTGDQQPAHRVAALPSFFSLPALLGTVSHLLYMYNHRRPPFALLFFTTQLAMSQFSTTGAILHFHQWSPRHQPPPPTRPISKCSVLDSRSRLKASTRSLWESFACLATLSASRRLRISSNLRSASVILRPGACPSALPSTSASAPSFSLSLSAVSSCVASSCPSLLLLSPLRVS